MLGKVAFEDRLDDVHHRPLYDAVSYRRYAQRTRLVRAGFGDVNASNRLGLEGSGFEEVRQFPNRVGKLSCKVPHRYLVHSRSAVILRDLLKRRQQIPFGKDFVIQSEPFASFHSLDESRHHACGPDTRLDPAPQRVILLGPGRSGLLSQRHFRRF